MNKLLTAALALPLVACVVGTGVEPADDGTGTGTGAGNGTGNGTGTNLDHITSAMTWSGTVNVDKRTVVDPGVTLTIAAGTIVRLAPAASITVKGTVLVQGVKGSEVLLSPATAGQFHGGVSVDAGGELRMAYANQTGGGIYVTGGKLTATDTRMSQASGDFLVVNAGTVDVSYSAIGLEPGNKDTTHCDMHFGGSGTTIKVTHSNISTSPYGLMLYGGNNVDLTYNNWFSNEKQIDTTAGVSGDISFGWFDKGAPTAGAGAVLTYNSPAAARLTDAGPR